MYVKVHRIRLIAWSTADVSNLFMKFEFNISVAERVCGIAVTFTSSSFQLFADLLKGQTSARTVTSN